MEVKNLIRTFKVLMSYFFKQYLRSNKYIAPLLFYVASIAFTYAQKPVYVMTSYMFTCVFIYFCAAWFMYSFTNSEEIVQQQLIILHIKKENYYYICRAIFIWIFVIILSVITVLYPVIGGFFIRKIYPLDIAAALLGHVIIGLLGISTALLFDGRIIKSGKLRFLYLVGVLIVSVIQVPLSVQYPFVKWITIVFPPAYLIIRRFGLIDVVGFASFYKLLCDITIMLIYSIVLILIFIKCMQRKKF